MERSLKAGYVTLTVHKCDLQKQVKKKKKSITKKSKNRKGAATQSKTSCRLMDS